MRLLGAVTGFALVLALTATTGCAGRVRYYDQYHSDYHTWNHGEDRAYHQYLGERHEQYRDYDKLNADQQRDYWNWRHDHPDKH
jgi:hypothetical protein